MKLIVSILVFLIPVFLLGQGSDIDSHIGNKARLKFNKANQLLKEGKKDKGTDILIELSKSHPEFYKARMRLAYLYLNNKEYDNARNEFLAISDLKDPPTRDLIFPLVSLLEMNMDFEAAIFQLDRIYSVMDESDPDINLVQRRMDELKFRKAAYDNPHDIKIEALDENINSDDSEYLPAFNAEGNIMLFTRAISRSNNPNRFSLDNEDLYMSLIDSSGQFSKAFPIVELNTAGNEGAHCFSQDGNILIFTACDRFPRQNGCDLFISFKRKNKWSEPINMGPRINTRHWESQPALSPDNKTLYFSSTRGGGYGGKDLWKVELGANGWSEPLNLGPNINTDMSEASPFIHADNETLYFRSNGHLGLGMSDLFVSKRSGDGWSVPVNMGSPINTDEDEGALFVDFSGNTAYYSSTKETGSYNNDIFKFPLPEELRPEKVSYIKLKVYDKHSLEPLVTKVNLTNVNDPDKSRIHTTDARGVALLVIQQGDYLVTVDKQEYIFFSENMTLDISSPANERFVYSIALEKLPSQNKEEISGTLNNIFFESGSAKLLDKSNIELHMLRDLLDNNKQIKLSIIGHTDSVGSEEDNLKLSEDRAKSVYEALVLLGADPERIEYSGKGESEPISANDSEEGRSSNRRTEFVIEHIGS